MALKPECLTNGTEAHPAQSYRERSPAREIAGQVASVWVLEVDSRGGAYEHRTVPNGSVEISYTLGSNRIEVSGPQRKPVVARIEPGKTVVGIRFRPGAAPSILRLPASELVDLRAERLGETGTPGGALRLLQNEIARRLTDATAPDPLVTDAVRRLQPWRSRDLTDWASGFYISHRQLRRRFVATLGYGPKTFHRIRRFQGFLALTHGRGQGRVDLARLAQRAGYADQAHLSRESVALTGLTPRAFLEEMWTSCGPNHDHEISYAGLRRALLVMP
jgi:AraC-like DNA-binding protein